MSKKTFHGKFLAILLAILLAVGGVAQAWAEETDSPQPELPLPVVPAAQDSSEVPAPQPPVQKEPLPGLLDLSSECGWSVDYHHSDDAGEQSLSSVVSGGILPDEAFYVTLNCPDLPRITLCVREDGLLLHDDTTGTWSELTWMGAPITVSTLADAIPSALGFSAPLQDLMRTDAEGHSARALLMEDLDALMQKLSPCWESFASSASVELLLDKLRSENSIQLQSDDLNAVCSDAALFLSEVLFELYDPVTFGPSQFVLDLNYGEMYAQLLGELRSSLLYTRLRRFNPIPPFQLTLSEDGDGLNLRFASSLFTVQALLTYDGGADTYSLSGSLSIDELAPIRFEGSLGDALWTVDFESCELAGGIQLNLPVDGRSTATATFCAYPIYDGVPDLDDFGIITLNACVQENRAIFALSWEIYDYMRYTLDLQTGEDFLSGKFTEYDEYGALGTFDLTLKALDESTFRLSLNRSSLRHQGASEDALTLRLSQKATLTPPTSAASSMEIGEAISTYFGAEEDLSAELRDADHAEKDREEDHEH